MTADEYVLWVISKYRVQTGVGSPAYQAGQAMLPLLAEWAGRCRLGATYSGSYAKGTAIRGATDVDLFISLAHDTPGTLKEIYYNLLSFLQRRGMSPRAQNVSIRVSHGSLAVDLTPGRKQSGFTTDHSLYRCKVDTWTQTNVAKHISIVQNSGRLHEICALKIWRQLHGLDFPSFYMELTVINALSGQRTAQPAANVLKALDYIASDLTSARVVDPANTNNVVSDDLNLAEKQKVANQARLSRAKPKWEEIIW